MKRKLLKHIGLAATGVVASAPAKVLLQQEKKKAKTGDNRCSHYRCSYQTTSMHACRFQECLKLVKKHKGGFSILNRRLHTCCGLWWYYPCQSKRTNGMPGLTVCKNWRVTICIATASEIMIPGGLRRRKRIPCMERICGKTTPKCLIDIIVSTERVGDFIILDGKAKFLFNINGSKRSYCITRKERPSLLMSHFSGIWRHTCSGRRKSFDNKNWKTCLPSPR